MSYPSSPDPQIYPFESQIFTAQQQSSTGEWTTLDKFLEWQREQAEFSSPESLIADIEQYYYNQSQSKLDSSSTWQYTTKPQQSSMSSHLTSNDQAWTPMSTSPSLISGPPSVAMVDESDVFSNSWIHENPLILNEATIAQSENRGPQLPKIGRPRSTPTITTDGETPTISTGTKAPGQARRRNQNREAQRAFRARQRQYIEQLAVENKELVTKNAELEERCDFLVKAYEKVVASNVQLSVLGKKEIERRHELQASGNLTGQLTTPWDLSKD